MAALGQLRGPALRCSRQTRFFQSLPGSRWPSAQDRGTGITREIGGLRTGVPDKNTTLKDRKEFSSGERLYLGNDPRGVESFKDHFDRYEFAKRRLQSDFRVVDAACGTGYGSEMMAESCKEVLGLEVSDHALAWARSHHARPNIEFKKTDLNGRIHLPSGFADVVVSFETLEHIAKQEAMIGEFKRILKPRGLLIISSPDRDIITGKAHLKNRFHVRELSKKEFVALLQHHFTIEDLYAQSKYQKQARYKRLIKGIIVKLDVLKLRRQVVRWLGLTSAVNESFSPLQFAPIQRVTIGAANDFSVLIALCRNS